MDALRKRENRKASKEKAVQKAKEYRDEYFSTHPCIDCGESDPIVLTFDHVRGEKRDNVSEMIGCGLGLETIKAEIEKCDVVCYNCHAIRTHERQESNRWKRVNGTGGW